MKCVFGLKDCDVQNQPINTNPYQFFIGYQINSSYYSQNILLAMGSRICEILKTDLLKNNLKIKNEQFGFKEAIHIFCEACKLIQKSILCIFEISDLNPNVMLEIGKSQYRNIILLRKKDSKKFPPIDLGGVYYEEYDDEEELLHSKSAKIARIINEKILEHHRNHHFKDVFYLKNDIKRMCKNDEFRENIDWQDLLEIYDEDKLEDPHDYTLIGIAKYKELKKEYLNDNLDIDALNNTMGYFEKSKNKDQKVIENDYFLYLLELLKLNIDILNHKKDDFTEIDKLQKKLDKSLDGCQDIISLIDDIHNRNLKKFLFIDSDILIDSSFSYSTGFKVIPGLKVYNVLKFLYKKEVINNFNTKVLELLKNFDKNNRYEIIGRMAKELEFSDIGEDMRIPAYPDTDSGFIRTVVPATSGHLADVKNSTAVEFSFQ